MTGLQEYWPGRHQRGQHVRIYGELIHVIATSPSRNASSALDVPEMNEEEKNDMRPRR